MTSVLPEGLPSLDALREIVPAPFGQTLLKIRPKLEASGRAWIEHARLAGLALRREDGQVDVGVHAARSGLAKAPDDHRIRIAADGLGETLAALASDPAAGAIFMLPGIDSTLRANGAARAAAGAVELSVAETYMHCPKAFVRSGLWKAPLAFEAELEEESGDRLGPASRAFVERAPFALLGTCLPEGSADVSPRGDPPGFVRVVDDRTLLVPDRPGNRIVDSFRNVLENPVAGLLFLIPGVDWTLRVSGAARVISDAAWLEPLAVKGKAPRLGIGIDVVDVALAPAPALAEAAIWSAEAHVPKSAVPTVGRAIVNQVEGAGRLGGAKGWVLDRLLDRDAKKNLY